LLNGLIPFSEPTRYRVVVLTSWDRTDRNQAGQIASAAEVRRLLTLRFFATPMRSLQFAFSGFQIHRPRTLTAKDAKISQRSAKSSEKINH
jgi:hypothetical protein